MKNKFILFICLLFFSSVNVCDAYTTFTTDNGQLVIVEENKSNPIVTIDTWIKTGSVNESDFNSGVSHFLEHLFFKGTVQNPTGAFDKILESKGAINNAATSKDFTHYYITIPSNEFDKALELHSDMLLNPLIPRKELEMERKVVLEEIAKNKDNPQRVLFNNLVSLLYENHPYHREVIGRANVIETISREEILNYYNKYYHPANMITVIVGDVDTDVVKEKMNLYFNKKAKKFNVANFYHGDKLLTKQAQKIEKFDIKNAYMLVGFRGVNYTNLKDSYALDVLATILGDGKTSRLYQNIKDKKQLVASISASHSNYKLDSLFAISATFEPDNFETIKANIFDEIEKLKNETISDQELQKAKNIIERDTYFSRESNEDIANQLGYMSVIYSNPKYYDTYIENIKKVTDKDIKRVVKKYLNINRSAVSVLFPKELEQKKCMLSEKKDLQPKSLENIGNIKKYELENGVKLIIEPNTQNDIVAIKIYSIGGVYNESIAGVASIVASSMMRGTKKYSSYELAQIMEEKGIKILPSSEADSFSLSIKCTKKELDTTLSLLDEVINNASFNSYEVDKVKKDKLALIKRNRDNALNFAIEEFKEKIWKGNPYGRAGKTLERIIPTITQEEILSFYSKIFEPKNVVVSVNGNVEDKVLIDYFSNSFQSKSDKVIKITDYKNKNIPVNKSENIMLNKEGQTAWIVAGWQVAGNENQKDWATLQVINSLLGTGMSSRLFVNLRDEQGLAYQIGSFYLSNINHGLFGVYIGTNPQNYNIARIDMLKEIENIKTQFVSQQELQEAKDKLLGHYLLSQETNMEKASTLGWYEASLRGVEFKNKYPQLINAVTAEDIINVANKYFNENYVMSIVAPLKELK